MKVDGRDVAVPDGHASLLEALRYTAGLTVAKDGCSQGRCGSCSVLLEGRLVTACTVLAADAVDAEVTTAAGFGGAAELSDVQKALLDAGGVQCGFCTPGMVVAIHDLLTHTSRPTEAQVRTGLAGNLCRCTGYGRIVAAVLAVASDRAAALAVASDRAAALAVASDRAAALAVASDRAAS